MVLESISYLREITLLSIMFRTGLSMLLGGLLGYERGKKGRPAGLRTYLVVCLGSSLAMMTGIYLAQMSGSGDAGRIAAQVISGIGFLGAGTILVTRQNQVKGLTTAAGLWAAACIGLALGAGFYSGAMIGFVAIWSSLGILSIIDSRIYNHSNVIHLYIEFENITSVSFFISKVREKGGIVRELETTKVKGADGKNGVSAIMELRLSEKKSHAEIIEAYGNIDGVLFIEKL